MQHFETAAGFVIFLAVIYWFYRLVTGAWSDFRAINKYEGYQMGNGEFYTGKKNGGK